MQIYRAIKTNLKTQGFGIYGTKPEMLETYHKLGLTAHNGFDWGAKDGEPVYWDCSIKGLVLNTEIDNNGGLGINVLTKTKDGKYHKHRFWHLKDFAIKSGDVVDSGQLIGWADNTGLSTGTHLHRDLKEMYKEGDAYQIKNWKNGFFGCIDYSQFFDNKFICDVVENLEAQVSILQRIIWVLESLIKALKGRVH